jgi:hypothetical protein
MQNVTDTRGDGHQQQTARRTLSYPTAHRFLPIHAFFGIHGWKFGL